MQSISNSEEFENTNDRILIPFNFHTCKYEYSQFYPWMSNNRIYKEKIEEYIRKIEANVESFNLKGKLHLLIFFARILSLCSTVNFIVASILYLLNLDLGLFFINFGSLSLISASFMAVIMVFFVFTVNLKVIDFVKENREIEGTNWTWRVPHKWMHLELIHGDPAPHREFNSDIPKSNSYVIVYKYSSLRRKFVESGNSREDRIRNITNEEIDECLDEVTNILKKTGYSTSRLIPKIFFHILYFLFILLILLLFVHAIKSEQNKILKSFSYILAVSTISIMIPMVVLTIKNRYIDSRKVRPQILNYISIYNTKIESKGMRWYVPYQFPDWIELWKDYNYYKKPNENHA